MKQHHILEGAVTLAVYLIGIVACYLIATWRMFRRRPRGQPLTEWEIEDRKEIAVPMSLFWPFTLAIYAFYLAIISPISSAMDRWYSHLLPPAADPYLEKANAEIDAMLKGA